MARRRQLHGVWLGRRAYEPVHQMQQELVERRRRGEANDTVLFVEHEPVVTLGRGAHAENLLVPKAALRERGIDVVDTGRGGDVTLHAPGQLVAYPILDLAPDRCDVRRYVGDLTETMRRLVREWDIDAGPIDGLIGLWTDRRRPAVWSGRDDATEVAKIGAIGVRISRWITMHGFALNLTTDLDQFGLIVPCGIRQFGVTSVSALTGQSPGVEATAERALSVLADVLDAEAVGFERQST